MKTLTLHNFSEPALGALGARIAQGMFPGAFLALFGDLGAGKTTFTRALAAARGIRDVTSPTFTIVHEYGGEPPLFHFDAYRLCAGDELYAIGFEDYLSRGGIIAVSYTHLRRPTVRTIRSILSKLMCRKVMQENLISGRPLFRIFPESVQKSLFVT